MLSEMMHPHSTTDADGAAPARTGCTLVLSGTIASGKSTVGRALGELGAVVLDADRVAHGVLEGEAVRSALRAAFGEEIFAPDGTVDRKALGAIVFADPEQLGRLNAIVHPDTFAALARRAGEEREAGRAVVIDVPLLRETAHLEQLGDVVVFVDAPLAVRRERAVRDRGWSEGELDRRESRQRPADEARATADVVVENAGTLEELTRKTEELWRTFVLPRLQQKDEKR